MRRNSRAEVPGRSSAWKRMFIITRRVICANVILKLSPGVSTRTFLLYSFFSPFDEKPRRVYSPFRSRTTTGAP